MRESETFRTDTGRGVKVGVGEVGCGRVGGVMMVETSDLRRLYPCGVVAYRTA